MGILFISSETVIKIFAFSIFDGIVRHFISRSLIIRLVFSSLRSLFQEVSYAFCVLNLGDWLIYSKHCENWFSGKLKDIFHLVLSGYVHLSHNFTNLVFLTSSLLLSIAGLQLTSRRPQLGQENKCFLLRWKLNFFPANCAIFSLFVSNIH